MSLGIRPRSSWLALKSNVQRKRVVGNAGCTVATRDSDGMPRRSPHKRAYPVRWPIPRPLAEMRHVEPENASFETFQYKLTCFIRYGVPRSAEKTMSELMSKVRREGPLKRSQTRAPARCGDCLN